MLAANANLLALAWDAQTVRWIVWGGLLTLTGALLLLIRTRWGQSQPLGKCVVLSLLAHTLLGIYMTTVNIVTASSGSPTGRSLSVAFVEGAGTSPTGAEAAAGTQRWAAIGGDEVSLPVEDLPVAPLAALEAPPLESEMPATPQAQPAFAPAKLPEAPPAEEAPAPESVAKNEPIIRPVAQRTEPLAAAPDAEPPVTPPVEVPAESPPEMTPVVPAIASATPRSIKTSDQSSAAKSAGTPTASGGPGGTASGNSASSGDGPPTLLRQRGGDHLGAGGTGATRDSEAAVALALRWLAANQSQGGRWDAQRVNIGVLSGIAVTRNGAGSQADAGLTGIALLAFLAAGNTHQSGEYRDTVRQGLEFLLRSQDSSGCVGLTTNPYERMYCHAMGACALSEAYAMTSDRRLLSAVRRAIDYSVRTQDPASGGWQYQAGQRGDTSQVGWQVLAMKSAELGGIEIPQETRAGIQRFLRSVATGNYGGLGCYQPAGPMPTRSMTAEALVCRQFLGLVDRPETTREAAAFILEGPPGVGQPNHYYWYYATLGLYQSQGDAWQRWNNTLQRHLLATQQTQGSLAGSWEPDPVWGRCGSRVYSTALCTLSLEVYYRFLPLYVEAAGRESRVK